MIHSKYNLKRHNTFGLNSRVEYFAQPKNLTEILQALDFANSKNLNIYSLGSGSNILLKQEQEGLIVQNSMQGLEVVQDSPDYQIWRAEAGINWHKLVMQTVKKKLFGLERLALIPGRLGAAPVQNIGAYGAEIGQFIARVEVLNSKGELEFLTKRQCEFSYRDSIFKKTKKYLILAVELKLYKAPVNFLPDYANLNLDKSSNSAEIAEKIIKIRQAKLPDPEILPNAGSFFKNPVISSAEFHNLSGAYRQIPSFDTNEGVKIPAAWLLEKAGFKGKRHKALAMYEKQPLVMVKYADANLDDILQFAQLIQQKIKAKFNIELEIEPQELAPIF